MRPVINLLSHFAELRNRPITLLVSTTGDTGPAAVHAVNDASNPLLTILVHYPHGQISDFQRKQLTTLQSNYVKVASFEGGGDDMDWPIKETLLSSKKNVGKGEVGGERLFCGINSYNIGRPLFQMTLFIWIYLRMAEKLGVSPGDESRYIILLFSLLLLTSSCIRFHLTFRTLSFRLPN
jgi:threonine synthase